MASSKPIQVHKFVTLDWFTQSYSQWDVISAKFYKFIFKNGHAFVYCYIYICTSLIIFNATLSVLKLIQISELISCSDQCDSCYVVKISRSKVQAETVYNIFRCHNAHTRTVCPPHASAIPLHNLVIF